jgi:hypothetical protein
MGVRTVIACVARVGYERSRWMSEPTSPGAQHPVVIAWTAAGRPEPNWQGKARAARDAPEPHDGICALLGIRAPVVPLNACVSDLFTSWDRLRHLDQADVGLSIPAAWAFRERVAMQRPHGLIAGAWRELDIQGLRDALRALHHDELVSVPASRQKHLLPWVSMGMVRTDDETLPWTTSDADRLDIYEWLRSCGFSSVALTEPAPRVQVLRRLDLDATRRVLSVWPALDPWRAHPAYMHVASTATRPIRGDSP